MLKQDEVDINLTWIRLEIGKGYQRLEECNSGVAFQMSKKILFM